MRKFSTMLLSLALAVVLGWSQMASAQSVKEVEWWDGSQIIVNSLLDAIDEDLDEEGNFVGPEDRVYQLQAGGIYRNTSRITGNFPIRLVGEEGGDFPPILQLTEDETGDADGTMIVAQNDLELRNLWIVARTTGGDEGWGQIDLSGDDATVVLDNIVYEYNFGVMIHNLAPGTDLSITNSHFRNMIDHNQWWAGRVLRLEAPTSRVFVENNTFFNIGHTVIQIQQVPGEFWFNHNTVVNIGKEVNQYEGVQRQNVINANNLYINGHWHGEDATNFSDIRVAEEDNQYGSWVNLDYLDPSLGFEEDRRVGIINNVQYTSPQVMAYYDELPADVGPDAGAPAEGDIRAAGFLNQRGQDIVNQFDQIKWENHLDLTGEDLGLQFEQDGHMDGLAERMIEWAVAMRSEDGRDMEEWHWDIPGRDYNADDMAPSVPMVWPFAENAENFTYTHEGALGHAVGGYPVGDLNWYPDQKAAWENERDDLEAQIRGMFEDVVETEVVAAMEAEDGQLSGDASIQYFDGFEYFHLEGGGVVWTFDWDQEGEYGLDVHHNKFDEGDRGQNILVNDVNLQNDEDYGEYFFPGDQPNNMWLVEEIRNDELYDGEIVLHEGENTVEISSSWGWQGFHGFDIVDANGDVVESFSIFDGNIVGAGALTCLDTPESDDEADFCPSGGAWVDFGSGGEVHFDIEFLGTGDYNLQMFYVMDNGSATADVMFGDNLAEAVTFEEASGEREVAVAGAYVEGGTVGITISSDAGGFSLDNLQLFADPAIWTTSADEVASTLPDGFELGQNYPNPFNPTTQINFEVPDYADVRLEVFNLLGQRVATLVDGPQNAGSHSIQFDAQNLSSGVYIYRLQVGNHSAVRKMTLIK